MKKIIFCFMAVCLSFTFLPQVTTAQKSEPVSSLTELKPIEAKIESRSSKEKLNVRSSKNKNTQQVVVSTRSHRHGGAYISVGGLLLILLLIIIIV